MKNSKHLYISVDNVVFNAIRSGKQYELTIGLNEDNMEMLIHAQENNIILVTDELPEVSYGAYLYNHGVFPYMLQDIKTLHVANDNRELTLVITGITTAPGTRFRWDFEKKCSVEDPDGDGCMWEITYHFKPQAVPKAFIMRWNPGISSNLESFREARQKWPDGFQYNWSIYDWKYAHKGDRYIMVRVGDGPNGVVYHGTFLSDPYEGDDWAGTGRKRYYVDMTVEHPCDPDKPCITIDELKSVLPEINWDMGHSGQLLTESQAQKLDELWDKKA